MTRRIAILSALLGGTLLASPGEFPLSSAYIAPTSPVFYRLRHENGLYREFQRDIQNPRFMSGAGGWVGQFEGSHIVVQSPKDKNGENNYWVFFNGRLVRFIGGGVTNDIPYNAVRAAPDGVPPPFFFGSRQEAELQGRKAADKSRKNINDNLFKNKWNKAERLSWPFVNPNENGMLYAGFAILSFALLFATRRLWTQIAGGVLFAVFGAALFLTFSRGSFLAAFLGCASVAAFGWKSLKSKTTLKILGAVVGVMLLGAGGVAIHRGPAQMKKVLTRGFNGKSSWSNEVRYKMWGMAPKMMVDAPDGWGNTNVGKAYLDWYEDVDVLTAPGSLMNDHLTRMARYGWTGRAAYVFSWFALLAALALYGWRRGNGGPFAAWLALAVAAWFNPVLPNTWLWLAPALSLLPVLKSIIGRARCPQRAASNAPETSTGRAACPWGRGILPRCLGGIGRAACPQAAARRVDAPSPLLHPLPKLSTLNSLLLTGLITGLLTAATLYFLHSKGSSIRTPVAVKRTASGAVLVKSRAPSSWIVDDGFALGGIFTCKEIRSVYMRNPELPGVGYVRSVDALPATGVRRLVLGGDAGDAWLKKIASNEAARKELPREVVFISPPFPPSAIPPDLFDACRVRYETGEFNARFRPGDLGPDAVKGEDWIEILPALELYVLDWMRYATTKW